LDDSINEILGVATPFKKVLWGIVKTGYILKLEINRVFSKPKLSILIGL